MRDAEGIVRETYALYEEFRRATQAHRDACKENAEYWKTQRWRDPPREPGEPTPVTPTLFSTLESMLADVSESYPEALIAGVEPGDDEFARRLTQLVRFVLKRRNYKRTYRAKCRSALIKGTSVQEVYWDKSLGNGLGDAQIREWDVSSFLWDPAFEDFQEGRAVFKLGRYPRSWYDERFPEKAALIRGDSGERGEAYSAPMRAGGERDGATLIECWRREYVKGEGRHRVHVSKLAGGVLLEDSRETHPEGMYAHGQYPFIVEPLYPVCGSPVGLGVVDVLRNLQTSADRLDQIIMKNALASGKPKMLLSRSADVDERGLLDGDAELVRGARIDEGAVRWMQAAPLSGYVLSYQQSKLRAIKEESGQNQFSRGEASGGVTAASAILALQEAGSKRSRLIVDQLFDGYERLVRMLISVLRENYTERRIFRIDGEPSGLFAYGGDGEREIDYDVSVHVQKQTAYTTLYQNELALQLLRAGVLTPEDALELMSFEGKDRIAERRAARGAAAMSGGGLKEALGL